MTDYVKLLTTNPNGVFATQNDVEVKTRVFQFLFADGNKIYFCTSREKDVFKQLKKNPYASFCSFAPDFNPVVSISGKAIFVEDMRLKKRALDENPSIKGIYKAADNPVFELFYIDVKEVSIFNFSEGTQTFKVQ